MYKNKKVSVVIPTYNEFLSIRNVIDDFFATGLVDEVVVVDNNALGNTKEEVSKTKAKLIHEPRQGYGYALMRGMLEAKGDLIVMCEGDGTFQAKDVEKLLSYSDEFDAVLGTRTSRAAIWSGAFMPFPVRFANWLWAKFIEVLFNGPILTDVGCTYKLISRKTLESIRSRFKESKGDGTFSPELMIWLIESKLSLIEIPVIFKQRVGDSMYTGSIWKAAKLGFRMIPLIFRYKLQNIFSNIKNIFVKNNSEIVIFCLTFLASISLLLFSSNKFPNDDQFILYRYIDNIAFGKGFVFNEGEKILGATTPLFTLLASFFKFIFKSLDTKFLIGIINSVLFSFSSVFFYRLIHKFVNKKFSYLAVTIFILNLSRVSLEGMESPLFMVASLGFLYYLLNNKHYTASVFLSFAILTRPDAGLIAVLAFVYWLWYEGWEKTIRYTCTCIVVALPWLIWSTWYFGSFIPASLIAKMHINEIINQPYYQAFKVQLSSFSRIYWGRIFDYENIKLQVLFNLLPFLLLVFVAIKKTLSKNNWILFVIPFVYFVAFSVSNPVMFPWYISQSEPFWLLISFIGFISIFNYLQKRFSNSLVQIFLIIIMLIGPAYLYANELISEYKGSKITLYEISQYINANKKQGDTIGVNNMGIIAYYTGNYLYDFFGLVNDYAYAFYKERELCASQTVMYVIPPSIMHTKPDWLVLSGKDEISPCFQESRWFRNNYQFEKEINGGFVWKLKN